MSITKAGGPGAGLKPTRETKISDSLRAYPEMIEFMARYNAHFELLRRLALRKLITPLVTIEGGRPCPARA